MHQNPVDLPERTVIIKGRSGSYVYLTQRVKYSPELKQTRPVRVAIGKLNEEGKLIPNRNYFEIFPYEQNEPGDKADFVIAGPHFVADKISAGNGLKELLETIFKDDSDKILDIATYMMMSENNVMQYFEDYGYNHTLFSAENFDDNAIGRLFKKIKVKDIDLFIRSWVHMHVEKQIYIAYDSTNMNSAAGNLELAEYGHAKDRDELPQVNLSIGYNQTDQVPLFYELFPGSIIDNTECEKMVERARQYGCREIGFILDRGYFSLRNIRYFEKHNYDYILMTKGNAKFIQEAAEEAGAVLKNGYSNYMQGYELYGMTVEKDLFNTGKKEYVHVYYNGIEAEKEKITINNRFNKMDEELEKKKEKKIKKAEDVKSYEKYYRLGFDENGYFMNYQRKDNEIMKLINKAGYFAIVTSKKMSAEEALETYRDRDAVEKIFRMEKTYLGNDVFRVHSEEKLESKVFVSFIALIIRNEIYQSLKELYKTNRKEYTVPKVLKDYERLGVTKLADEKYHIRYRLTNKQKKILKALGATEEEYRKFVNEQMDMLVNN
ncbi:IS1634 family transposase [Traorella massiliensis]|uniref:IS1634 family transposase n=5 Tax=Traorella massiliensis TaxID=1903263 RepID=UPI0008F81485|nr:IS1634 family transposase [Traorella massiliensis]